MTISKLALPFRCVFYLTLLTLLVVLISVALGLYYPYFTSSVSFLCAYMVINMYMWTMAFCYTPEVYIYTEHHIILCISRTSRRALVTNPVAGRRV